MVWFWKSIAQEEKLPKVFFTPQVVTELSCMAEAEGFQIRQGLIGVQENPTIGVRLWGSEDLYVFRTASDASITYRLHGAEIHVLGITNPLSLSRIASSSKRVCAVVLAAGNSPCSKEISFSRIADLFLEAGVDNLVLVVGDNAEQARLELGERNVTVVVNSIDGNDMSTSLRYGLKMVPKDADAIMLALGSRSNISVKVVAELIRVYKEGKARVVVPAFSKKRGHPVIFHTDLLPELLKARGNSGGRGVVKRHYDELVQVDVDEVGVLERAWQN